MNQKCLQTTLAVLLVSALSTLGAVRYVNVNSTNASLPYTSWATAARIIQDAVDVADPGDQVLVTNGVYKIGGRAVLSLTNRVTVTKPLLLQSVNGPQVTIIQGYQVPNTTNGPSAVRCAYLTKGAVLVGFTLSGGATLETAGYFEDCNGGGVYCESLGGVVSNCVLSGNSAATLGGGGCGATFDDCVFENNTALEGGGFAGAVEAVSGDQKGVLNHCTIRDNYARDGGGVAACVLSNCTLSGNVSRGKSGYGYGYGGGAVSGVLYNCTLTDNSAEWGGGGANASDLFNCTLVGNRAAFGGGVWARSIVTNCVLLANFASSYGGAAAGATLSHCTLAGNSAPVGGGSYQANLDRCTLITNVADWYGGGAYAGQLQNSLLISNAAGVSGGGTYADATVPCTLKNCTVVGNQAGWEGGGVYASMLTNCIVYNNNAPNDANYSWGSLQYCCTTPLPKSGEGNIAANPLFVDLSAGDWRLQSNSPCINAGYLLSFPDNLDLDGNPRLVGSAIDLGAYEYPGPPLTPFQAWLRSYGLATDGSADYTDPDADGMNNWKEWRCGTIPTNALSVLKLLSASRTGSGVILAWQSVANRTYLVERGTGNGAHITFTPVASNLAGQENLTTYTDPSATGNGAVFYRVGVPE